ncbi:MAG: hypothetical protein AB8G95_03920 [Anaerolineae bacterium]
MQNLKEAAAEKVVEKAAETIIEQTAGIEDLDIDFDEDSASFSMTDEEGNEVSVSSEVDTEIQAIEGMGFVIAVPTGLTKGYIQRIGENGEDSMVTATFEVTETTADQFFDQLHQELNSAGFVYLDAFESGLDHPDPSAESFLPFVTYEHPDGYNFTVIWGEESAILGLSKV